MSLIDHICKHIHMAGLVLTHSQLVDSL